jgi:putative phosphoribosyl transferase
MIYRDRRHAGRSLAEHLAQRFGGRDDVLVLALPRGGVPVAFEVAEALGAQLDLMLVRKLGVPGHEELAMGAIASGGVRVLNEAVVQNLNIPPALIEQSAEREQLELQRREQAYRGDRPAHAVSAHTVILIDDGLATGATMRAAVAALRAQQPRRIVVAVPVASTEACATLSESADEVICLQKPPAFRGVGQWYQHFDQTSDDEVRALLRRAWENELA